MTIRRTIIIIALLTLAALALSLWAYPQLPELVPSHWNAAGEVDGWMPRLPNVLLIPGLMIGMGLLLLFIPHIDPLRANVERFRGVYNGFILVFTLYLLFLHIIITLAGLGIEFNMNYAIIPAIAVLFFCIGLLLDRAKQNWFIGVRTPWTLSSPTVWDKTHKLGAVLFKISAGIMILGMLLPPDWGVILIMVAAMGVALVTVVYSYFTYRKEQQAQG
jgi:uncharacterized membrane protein